MARTLARWGLIGSFVTVALVGIVTVPGAASTAPKTVEAGTITCAVTGQFRFTPNLTNVPATITTTLGVQLRHCRTTPGTGAPFSGTGVIKDTFPNYANCAAMFGGPSNILTGHIRWWPPRIAPSEVTFSGFQTVVESSGDVSFEAPGADDTASVTGSYAGGDMGATTRATVSTSKTLGQLATKCGGVGLSTAVITGALTLG